MLYSIDNGSPSVMSVDKAYAAAGDTVTVTNLTSSALPWTLDGVSQTDLAANGSVTFTMPASNVVVAETVAAVSYSIYYTGGYSMYAAGPTSAHAGDTVTVSSSAPRSTVIHVQNMSTNAYIVRGASQSASFTMPDANVLVELAQSGGASPN